MYAVEGPLVAENDGVPVAWAPETFPLQETILEAIADARWQRVVLINQRYACVYTTRFVPPEKRGKLAIFPDYTHIEPLQEMGKKIDRLKTLVSGCEVGVDEAVLLEDRIFAEVIPTSYAAANPETYPEFRAELQTTWSGSPAETPRISQ